MITPEHADYLRKAAITDDVTEAAGIYSEGGHLVFPWRRPSGEVVNQWRPDNPAPGGPKYLFPPDVVPVVNVHPMMRERVADPSVPVVIVEGTKQYLAAVSHLSDGYAAVGIAGCTGWVKDGAAVPDMAAIPWEGREVIVAFDADAETNRDVWNAASALTEVLLTNGASAVRYAKIPGMGKAGLDDALGRAPDPGKALANIIGRAAPKLPRKPAAKRQNGRNVAGVAGQAATPLHAAPSLSWDVAGVAGVAAESGALAHTHADLNGAELLDEVVRALTAYVWFSDPLHAVAVALYAAATHAVAGLQVAPRLRVKSPVKQCGKSRLLTILACIVNRAVPTANVSTAALVRSIGASPGTLIMDESDAVFRRDAKDDQAETLRGILNAGFERGWTYDRYNASTGEVEHWPTFAMAVIAGIGDLPDTIEDRSIIIPMARKTADAKVARFRIRRDPPALRDLGARLHAWAGPRADEIGTAEPAMPPGMSDRAEDAWEPLLAVADLAGAHWPDLARAAARRMATEAAAADAERSMAARLLADLRTVLGGRDKLHGYVVVARLAELDGSPWRDYSYGKWLSQPQLAGLLRPFGIRPKDVRAGGEVRKGYYRDDFTETWKRYLPDLDNPFVATPVQTGDPVVVVTPAPSVTAGDVSESDPDLPATPATPATPQVSEGMPVAAGDSGRYTRYTAGQAAFPVNGNGPIMMYCGSCGRRHELGEPGCKLGIPAP